MGSGSDHRADAGTRLVSLAGLRSLVRPFFVLFALYLVASLPLLRANYYWSQVKSATPKSEINRQSRPI